MLDTSLTMERLQMYTFFFSDDVSFFRPTPEVLSQRLFAYAHVANPQVTRDPVTNAVTVFFQWVGTPITIVEAGKTMEMLLSNGPADYIFTGAVFGDGRPALETPGKILIALGLIVLVVAAVFVGINRLEAKVL